MATIERYELARGPARDRGRYMVRYRRPSGVQTTKRGFRTRREAEAYLATVQVSALRGEYIDVNAGRVTIGTLGTEWLAGRAHTKPSGERSVESAWRVHVEPRWGQVQVVKVRATDIRVWIAELSENLGPNSVARIHGVLSGILEGAVADRRIGSNPARGVKLPRRGTAKSNEFLTHTQVALFANEAKQHAIEVYVLAYTGLRWSELAGLLRRHIDLRRGRVSVERIAVFVGKTVHIGDPKDYERRTVPLPAFVVTMLADHCRGMQPDDIVFPAAQGGYAKPPGHNTWWDGAVQRCIKNTTNTRAKEAAQSEHGEATTPPFPRVTPHDMRHTAASLAISAGAHVKAVQRMLGHSSATLTLDTYADLFPDDLDSVAVALDRAATLSA
ncbi:Tyrosine recombinase XerD [Tsukamurella paurometabola]|uniref:Tyrosine recombinase XerD n=2 Tax=Tsukamurella paurometabola TaxID=2061 RepID=A0A3P8L4L0_TSUPA|nr:Tyrosine recombinase XerD [Tsukamurella paurometabola]